MNKDDLDLFRLLTKPPKNNSAIDLITGVGDRERGVTKKYVGSKENLQQFAEEQLVRKQDLSEMRCEMPGQPRSTFLMVFSPDGRRAASTHGNHNIYVTDLRSGKNIKTLVGHPRTPWCIAFHPTSDQIVASGCLGGQVRIWDLSGGSEVWTTSTQTVVASIAFHPNDRVLVIATFNEVYFWDWSKPEPFVHAATSNPKEKVRYVAFDKLGHKLITGIANSPQTRWERVRAPVPVPRQERCASSYRRRITQRLVNAPGSSPTPMPSFTPEPPTPSERNTSSVVPERERRITMCYRNLVREYELLVHRYLQLYRPPTMIDRGTDPMEPSHYNSGTQTTSATSAGTDPDVPGPSGLQNVRSTPSEPGPSSSSNNPPDPESSSTLQSQNLITPSRIFSVGRKPPSSIRGTQTTESRKHKSEGNESNKDEKRFKREGGVCGSNESGSSREASPPGVSRTDADDGAPSGENSRSSADDHRVLVVNLERLSPERLPPTSSNTSQAEDASNSINSNLLRHSRVPRFRHTQLIQTSTNSQTGGLLPAGFDNVRPPGQPGTTNTRYRERFLEYIRSNRERILQFRQSTTTPDAGSSPARTSTQMPTHADIELNMADTPWPGRDIRRETIQANIDNLNSETRQRNTEEVLLNIRRTAEEEVRNRILPIIRSVPPPDRPELIRLFENSREHVRMRFRQMCPVFLRRHGRRPWRIDSSTDSSSSDTELDVPLARLARQGSGEPSGSQPEAVEPIPHTTSDSAPVSSPLSTPSLESMTTPSPHQSATSLRRERNYNTALEQLVTSLLTEYAEEASPGETNPSGIRNTPQNSSSSARTRPSRSNSGGDVERVPTPPGESLENIFQIRPQGSEDRRAAPPYQEPSFFTSSSLRGSLGDLRESSFGNTDTRTTNSTVYTPSPTHRRRFFSHRVSAFMPTRVNYTRTRFRRNTHYTWGSGRAGIPRTHRTPSLVLDELINYAERENPEDEPPPAHLYPPFEPPPEYSLSPLHPENTGIASTYSNIVQDLASSLNEVRNLRTVNRPGEASDMLSSFSERLENIMSQSDTILRNLRSSIDLLPNVNPDSSGLNGTEGEPRWNFNDPGFYVRDLRTDPANNPAANLNAVDSSLQDLIGNLHAVATDHTYPRSPSSNDNLSPLMNSLHMTISTIQRQARLLRRQVEGIERIDRAMVEVGQLQLMRQLVIVMVRHLRLGSGGESRSAGVSSVRQMMAGTRISDSSPYESPNEEPGPRSEQQVGGEEVSPQPGTSSSTSNADQSGPSAPSDPAQPQRRSTNRKTYPPFRYVRYLRQNQRRPTLVHWLNRFERGIRQMQQTRSGGSTNRTTPAPSPAPAAATTSTSSSNSPSSHMYYYSNINASTLSLMTRRLERLLTEQSWVFTRADAQPTPLTTASVDLGEHILALRLHGCLLRMNRVLGNSREASSLRNLRSDATSAAATQDATARYAARHTLSLIVDGLSRYIEELGGSTNLASNMRVQIYGVLALSLLLIELLLLQVADSIPPPSGMISDLDSLWRIDELYNRMFDNGVTRSSAQLTRSFRLMRLTMRHARLALDQTYIARRNAMLPRPDTDRRQLLGTINRCLRTINRVQERTSDTTNTDQRPSSSSEPSNSSNNDPDTFSESFYSTINDLITRYSTDSREDESTNQPSTSRPQNRDALSSNNSDDDTDGPEEPDWFYHRGSARTNHTGINSANTARGGGGDNNGNRAMNLMYQAPSSEPPTPPPTRPVNVPSVQVNDVPVSEPSIFAAQRLLSRRQMLAERISELRSSPRVGLFRPRFLHPLYASVNPFDADLDDPQREQIYDSDMITTVTPNHRIQAWDISNWTVPSISNSVKNVVVSECKIHNDASVDIATDGTILVTLLPSGGYLNVTNRLGVYSLRWETLGQCLYTTSFEQNAVSVSLSPLSRHLVVGFASRRVTMVPTDRWVMARIYKIEQKDVPGDRLPILRELEQHRESRINCIRWLPTSGQGLIYATNTGQLVILS